MTDSLGKVLNGLAGIETIVAGPDGTIRADVQREHRKGVPEVVYAAGKTPRLTLAAVRALLERQPSGRVLVSRAAPVVPGVNEITSPVVSISPVNIP